MEELKNKLAVKNSTIQSQAIRRLYELVINHKKSDEPLGPDDPQPAELGLLLEKVGEQSELLAVSCSEALVQLVLQGHVQHAVVHKGLLNAVPTARNLVGIAGALSDLMVSELITITQQAASSSPSSPDSADNILYVCPYGIRSRPHPFISLLTSRADSWAILMRQVQRILRWPHDSVQENIILLLQPFLRFVLLEPPTSQQFLQLRLSLPRLLLSSSSRVKDSHLKVVHFLEDAVSCLQIKTPAQVGEAWALLDQLSHDLTEKKDKKNIKSNRSSSPHASSSERAVLYAAIRGRVAGHCLGLAAQSARLEQSVDSEGLVEMAARLLKSGVNTESVPRVWLMTGELLLEAADRHVSYLLNIVRLCVMDHREALPRPLLACMVLPLLHITSAPPRVGTEKRTGPARAARLLQELAELLSAKKAAVVARSELKMEKATFCITPEGASLDVYSSLTVHWEAHPSSCKDWLNTVESSISTASSVDVPDDVLLAVCGVCAWSSDKATLTSALNVIAHIAKSSPEQTADLLPLFLFCLGFHDDPGLRLTFLEAMPKVATHKASVAPILKTLQLLGDTQALRPVALRLVTALWKKQDRCFPYLQRMLQASQGVSGASLETGQDELLLAKAACIKDICEERPHQHGADMLTPLSTILNECTRDQEVVPACLALEGLIMLCEAEVVDIRTVWAVLAPKLSNDPRPQVARRICELFSLVPSLNINSAEYQEFRQQILRSLWERTQHADGVVSSAAYRALTSFSREDLALELLPSSVTQEFLDDNEEGESTPMSAEPREVPGVCFVRLLEQTREDTTSGYGEFLTWLVSEEVRELPRGVYHSALTKRSNKAGADKVLSTVPQLLHDRYERVKQPGLRASLAAGLLFSYDPQPEVGRDGKVRRPALVAHGRNYHQKLYSLLHEVLLQPSDWLCSLSIPTAWVSFMDRCYHAYIESRRAELAMSLDQGQVNDPEEHEQITQTAWLWARDKLTDLIKSASRGGPSIQANCILALAGLAVTATRYASGLDEVATAAAKEATEHLGHRHWLTITVNTLMSVLDPTYQSPGRVFSMCQQHPGQSLSSATTLARGAACLALPLLVPILLTINTATIAQTIDGLTRQLPGGDGKQKKHPGAGGGGGTAAPLFPGLGLGALLARLLEEQFAHVAGNEGKAIFTTALQTLEEGAFNDSDHRQGCLLGLALCLPLLCKAGRPETRSRITTVHNKLDDALQSLDPKDITYTGTTICMAVLAVSAYMTGHLNIEGVNQLVAQVHEAHCNDINDSGLAVALAGLCHGLRVAGHPTVEQLSSKLATTWLNCLLQQDLSTLQRLCVMHGLLSLAGADATLFSSTEEETTSDSGPISLPEVVKAITKMDPADLGLQTAANWRLGQLYMQVGTKSAGNAAVPGSYHYLPETSVLRPVVDRLLQSGKSNDLQEWHLLQLLRCLVEGPSSRPLPPLNWTTLLSPILRLNVGQKVTELCLQLAIRQATAAPTASLLLTSYMLAPLWNNLDEKCKIIIYENMDTIIKAISPPKLREFLTKSFLQEFESKDPGGNEALRKVACKGLLVALQVPDPPQAVTLALHQTLEALYEILSSEPALYSLVAACLKEVPDHLIDSITKEDFSDGVSFVKASYTRCYLVSMGSQPLAWLNPAIEMALWENDSALLYNTEPKAILLDLVVHCFHQYRLSQSDTSSSAKFSQWLLELMGHVRSVANGTVAPPEGNTVSTKTVEFGMQLFMAVIVMMSGCGRSLVLSVSTISVYQCQPAEQTRADLARQLTRLLPHALLQFVEADQWKRLNPRIIDWLISMYSLPVMNELPHVQDCVKACLRAVRHTVDFKKMATWSQAYML